MLLENFKQSVNMGWGIDWSKVQNKGQKINQPGFIIQTEGDPNKVLTRYEPVQIAKDLYTVDGYIEQMGKNAGGGQDIIQGKGDPAANTLGESQMVFGKANLRFAEYIGTFESFLRELYEVRDKVNMAFIDEEFAFLITGSQEWHTVTPEQIRSDVEFLCDSSERETNRVVISQQILQLIQVAPTAVQNGQPMRIDYPMAKLCRQGFNWPENDIEKTFPLLKFEKDNPQIDINQMLVENSLIQMGLARMMALQGAMSMGQPGTGQQLPQPTTDSDAIQSANKRNQPENIQAEY
jgi:hypothetical protein